MILIYEILSRILDIVISLCAIFLLSPLLITVAIVLRVTGEGEVFYQQKRVGRDGQTFNLLKFATMLKNSMAMQNGPITIRNDPRVLPLGKMLRKTKINELPQLLNILKGDMSIVGPRPLLAKQFNFYSKEGRETITQMRPGLTGVSSILFRDEEKYFNSSENPDTVYKSKISPVKQHLEVWFFHNRSIVLYLKIIFFTALAILFPKLNIIAFFPKSLKKSKTKENVTNA
jgi:lipopolysaccharide/colanic/teichoic acid biosynthesis glycosyltransferase